MLFRSASDGMPVHVLSYDEKPGIQAIATTSPDLMPDKKHSTISRDYEYKRLGTLSLLTAIDLQTGEAIPLVRDKHSSKEYIEFLELLDDKYPKEDKIRIVLDNLKVHTSEATRKYLATVSGRFEYKTKYYILESTAALAMRCNSIILVVVLPNISKIVLIASQRESYYQDE